MVRPRPGVLISAARWAACAVSSALVAPALAVSSVMTKGALNHKLELAWARFNVAIFRMRVRVDDRNGPETYARRPLMYVLLRQTSLAENFATRVGLPDVRQFAMQHGGNETKAGKKFTLANFEYLLSPCFGWVTLASGFTTVVRQWPWQAKRALDSAASRVKRGDVVYMSVEGRRRAEKDGELSEYKRGAAVLAIKTQATIIPVIFFGAEDLLPHGEWRVRPGTAHMVLCEAVSAAGLTLEDRALLTQSLRTVALKEIRQYQLQNAAQTTAATQA